MQKMSIHPVDLHVGQRLREGRILREMSQAALGACLQNPVSFQQIQKYERGTNRVSVSTLYEFVGILQFPITYFLPETEAIAAPSLNAAEIGLLKNYRRIPVKIQNAIRALLLALENQDGL